MTTPSQTNRRFWALALLAALLGAGTALLLHQARVFHSANQAPVTPMLLAANNNKPWQPRDGGPPGPKAKGPPLKEKAKLNPSDVPREVLEAFKPLVADFAIMEATRKRDAQKQETEYELVLKAGQQQFDAKLVIKDGNGSVSGELDGRIPATDLPKPVIEAYQKYRPGHTVEEVDKKISFVRGGKADIEYQWKYTNPKGRLTVNADGTLLDLREVVGADQVPEAVRRTVEQHLPGAQLEPTADKRWENQVIVYRLEARAASGQKAQLVVSEKGEVLRLKGNQTAATPAPGGR